MADANTQKAPSASPQIPDAATLERIKHLAIVGKALFETESEATFETNFFLAKEALLKFEAGINKLKLSPELSDGMSSLIRYLKTKVDKRLQKTTDENMWMT